MEKPAGIVLAAGLSSRMGKFKPLLEIGGVSMVRRVVQLMRSAGADPVMVVTGHRRGELESHLAGDGVVFIHNPDYACTQQLDSLRLALAELPEECGRVMVSPADIPLVRRETAQKLLAAQGDFIRPRYGARAGHPVVLAGGLIAFVRGYDGPDGLKGAVARSGCSVQDVPADDPNILADNDTWPDFQRTLARFEEESK